MLSRLGGALVGGNLGSALGPTFLFQHCPPVTCTELKLTTHGKSQIRTIMFKLPDLDLFGAAIRIPKQQLLPKECVRSSSSSYDGRGQGGGMGLQRPTN